MTATDEEPTTGDVRDVLLRSLRLGKAGQRARLRRLSRRFADAYAATRRFEPADLVRADWRRRNRSLERRLLPVPPMDFLGLREIRDQMVVAGRCLDEELAYLQTAGTDDALLAEDVVGEPPLLVDVGGVVTSPNTVHHVHHLRRFERSTAVGCDQLTTVVEWGGGYGNLAKLFRRIHGGTPTYAIVDTPLFSCLQWLYLATIFGEEETHLVLDADDRVRPGCFNMVPLGLAGSIEIEADLFVSTWALNESPEAAHAIVLGRGWFGAPHLLLGMHDGDPLAAHATADGARVEPVGECMPPQRYLFR